MEVMYETVVVPAEHVLIEDEAMIILPNHVGAAFVIGLVLTIVLVIVLRKII